MEKNGRGSVSPNRAPVPNMLQTKTGSARIRRSPGLPMMRAPPILILLLASAPSSAIISARDAEACTCSVPVLVSPSDGSSGVPPNAVVVVRSPKPIALMGTAGQVAVEVDTLYSQSQGVAIQRARPTASLAPGQYEIYVDDVLASTFEVDGAADTIAPTTPVISNAGATFTPRACASSCGDSYTAVDLAVASSGDAIYYRVTLASDDSGASERYERTLFSGALGDLHSLGGAECGTTPPPMAPGSAWEVTLVAHDIADNASEPSTASFVVEGCAELECGKLVPGSCQPPTEDTPGSGCMAAGEPVAPWVATIVALLLVGIARRRAPRRVPELSASPGSSSREARG